MDFAFGFKHNIGRNEKIYLISDDLNLLAERNMPLLEVLRDTALRDRDECMLHWSRISILH